MADEVELFTVSSIYGNETGQGLVRFRVGDTDVNMMPVDARHLAISLLSASSAAEGDEALVKLLLETGMNQGQAGFFLKQYRAKRHELFRDAEEEWIEQNGEPIEG
jgi:hypothetical protein